MSQLPARLTDDQTAALDLMTGNQTHTCLVGGSRSGKTTLIVRAILMRAMRAPDSRHLITRFRANAVRASVWLDTYPKVLRTFFPGVVSTKRYDQFEELANGSQIWFGGLDEKDRIEKILGQEYATIYAGECSQIPYSSILILRTRLAQPGTGLKLRGFYDLNPTSTLHWTNVQFGDKKDPISRLPLQDPENYERAFLNPEGNKENLDPDYLRALSNMPKQYRERFYAGKYVTDVDGALWTVGQLEMLRDEDRTPEDTKDLVRIVIGVDPSGAQAKTDTKSDYIGIVVVGLKRDKTAVVLEDASMRGGPGGKDGWGTAVVAAFKKWKADLIVAESNYGGGMVESTIKAVNRNAPVKLVTASRGKVVRAEPVAALYDEERVRHAGTFAEMEEQMIMFARSGFMGDKSPDRADALVWALTELMLEDEVRYDKSMNWVGELTRRNVQEMMRT